MYADFCIKFDPEKETNIDLTNKIIYSIFIGRRVKKKKPAIAFIGGDSGEGKSISGLALQLKLCQLQGIDFNTYMDIMNVYTPLEYPTKLKKILYDKEYKDVNIICTHEARDIIRAKNWQNFLCQAIADVNAQSRQIKPLFIIIISQFIRDIVRDVRYTLNFYIKAYRLIGGTKRVRLYIKVLWKDDRDIEAPKLRTRRIRGYIIYPNGKKVIYTPEFIEVERPPKEIVKAFEDRDRAAKMLITQRKMDTVLEDIKKEVGLDISRTETLVDFYIENPYQLLTICKRKKDSYVITPEGRAVHNLTESQAKEFQEKLNTAIKKQEQEYFDSLKDMGIAE